MSICVDYNIKHSAASADDDKYKSIAELRIDEARSLARSRANRECKLISSSSYKYP